MRPGTLRGYLAAISVVHQTAQLENPTRSEAVRRTLAGIGRHPAVAPPRRRAAARRDPLLELLRALRPDKWLVDARDHALLLVGWKAALRSDDLARLRMEDLHASEQGLSVHRPLHDRPVRYGPRHRRPRSRDRGGGGVWAIDAARCRCRPDRLAGPARLPRHPRRPRLARDRPLRPPTRTGGLHRNSIAEVIKCRAAAAGLEDAQLWGGHGLRRGFATEAIAAGVPERDVQRHARWRSRASMDPYIDAARTFDATDPTYWVT